MSWWPFNVFCRPANPRDSWVGSSHTTPYWRLPDYPQLDPDEDDSCPCASCGGRNCICQATERARVWRSPHVPQLRHRPRSRLPVHNPGVSVRSERAHLLTPHGSVNTLPAGNTTQPWVPMNPFVGPSLVSTTGKKGDIQVSTPFITPAGVSLAAVATPAVVPPVIPTPAVVHTGVLTPAVMAAPVIPTPAVVSTPAFVAPVIPATPSHPAASILGQTHVVCPWVPHPWPAPNIPGTAFWPAHWLSVPRTVLAADSIIVNGGIPLPGTVPMGWTEVWPPRIEDMRIPVHMHPLLAPNPFGTVPHLDWDISYPPDTARRITGRDVVIDIRGSFNNSATYPGTQTMVIACDFILQESWGPIVIRSNGAIKVIDVLMGIYEYFQQRLTEGDVHYLQTLDGTNYRKLCDAWNERCRRSYTLRDYERRQGLKRVDLFGDNRKWWGLWISYSDGRWYAHLGTVSVPFRYE